MKASIQNFIRERRGNKTALSDHEYSISVNCVNTNVTFVLDSLGDEPLLIRDRASSAPQHHPVKMASTEDDISPLSLNVEFLYLIFKVKGRAIIFRRGAF